MSIRRKRPVNILLASLGSFGVAVTFAWFITHDSFAQSDETGVEAQKSERYAPAPVSEKSKEGKALFDKLQCSQCHSIGETGGCLAPPLDGVGGRRSREYLNLRLNKDSEDRFIKLIGHPELLPHPRFAKSEVDKLIAYLLTIPGPAEGFKPVTHPHAAKAFNEPAISNENFHPGPITADSREGRRLFLENGCMACHAIGEAGGFLAPRLDGIGARHSRAYIEAHITNPQAHKTGKGRAGKSKMPQFEFQPNEVKEIADFLLTLPRQHLAAPAKP